MRYAISGETKIAKTYEYDVVIVGAGLAGLYAALNIDESLSCIILAKENMDNSSSWLAQGGIAAAINRDDTPLLHFEDTVVAGAGECDTEAVSVLVNEGPADIENLARLNVPFDLDEFGEFHFTREGGHKKRRVVHAGGDATGRETIRALAGIVSERKNITFSGYTCLFDVITSDSGSASDSSPKVTGVVVRYKDSEFHHILTKNVIIATGGIGQLYLASTNPPVATGDGIAAAIRAGVRVSNIEFIQFHPTGLWSENSSGSEFLISEAVRGDGGILVNSEGERFMLDIHELAELAPRDIVARAIVRELKRSGESCVYVDITSKTEDFLMTRFPTIYNECLNHGINIAVDRIPVNPVQHYMMGGIETDICGLTSVSGLYACGEAANTGVHGANRLASNSMLECLVFGRRAAAHINNVSINDSSLEGDNPQPKTQDNCSQEIANQSLQLLSLGNRPHKKLDYTQLRKNIQQLMSENCFVIRNTAGLKTALAGIEAIYSQLKAVYDDCNDYLETLNIATVAIAIVTSALNRPQSIGAHYMEDYRQ
ncbi:MAG: L-aspartate oxidase [Oscillospiraceae bacterium]|nr:L-aspartate oxidase [Oscillospiraceae bacterium]